MTSSKILTRRLFTAMSAIVPGLLLTSTPAKAGTGRIVLHVGSAGFIIGVSGGHGELFFDGKNFPLNAGGVSIGLTIGASGEDLKGVVENINRPEDIQGTYAQLGGEVAVGAGGTALTLSNPNGVVLKMEGFASGFEASLNLGGLTIALM